MGKTDDLVNELKKALSVFLDATKYGEGGSIGGGQSLGIWELYKPTAITIHRRLHQQPLGRCDQCFVLRHVPQVPGTIFLKVTIEKNVTTSKQTLPKIFYPNNLLKGFFSEDDITDLHLHFI